MTQEVFMEFQIYWLRFGALAALGSGILYLCALVYLARQVRLQHRALQAQMFSTFFTRNQDPELLEARRTLYDKVGLEWENPEGWNLEETRAAEKACNAFDIVGILADQKYVKRGIIVKHWRGSLIRTWDAAQPVIRLRRHKRPDYWEAFKKLVEEARELEKRVR